MIDTLTNIPSSHSLKEDLKNTKFPILFLIDIKDFKLLNLTSGDEAGNLVLKSFAKSLSNFAKKQDMSAYRIKDDEFALLKNSSFDLDVMEKIIFDLLAFVSSQKYIFEDSTIEIEANIGISFDLNNSLKKAKLALTLAQRENQPFISYSQFATKLLEEKDMDTGQKVEAAIKNNYITPYYQKVVDLHKQTIYDEVLIRITIENSIQPPKFFLETAKKRGFYTSIVRLLSEKILKTEGTKAINFSFEDLEDSELLKYLLDTYNGKNIIFELHNEDKRFRENIYPYLLKKLKHANISICLDNIVSAKVLNHIDPQEVSFVKVDGSLIRLLGISNEAKDICNQILNECKRLGCKSIATHINSQASFEEAKRMGFDYFQGFFFGKPTQKG